MIVVTDQQEMLEIGEIFLHSETTLTQEEVVNMDEFDKYYETREMIKRWNSSGDNTINNKLFALEMHGFNIKN
jgi:hypothetical protein